jgi:hypothetical protein
MEGMQNARREPNSIPTAESTWRRLRKAHASSASPHPPQYRFQFKTPRGEQPFLSNSPEDPRSDSTKIRFQTSITTNSVDQMSVKIPGVAKNLPRRPLVLSLLRLANRSPLNGADHSPGKPRRCRSHAGRLTPNGSTTNTK